MATRKTTFGSGKTTTKKMASGGKADPVNTYSAARAKSLAANQAKINQTLRDMASNNMYAKAARYKPDSATQQKLADYHARKAARQAAFAQTDAGKAQAQTQAAARTQQRAQDVANARAQSAKMLSGGMKKGGKAKAKKK